MGDGRHPQEPLYIEGSAGAERLAVRIGALQAAATLLTADRGKLTNDSIPATFMLAERFEKWLTR